MQAHAAHTPASPRPFFGLVQICEEQCTVTRYEGAAAWLNQESDKRNECISLSNVRSMLIAAASALHLGDSTNPFQTVGLPRNL